MSSLKPRNVMLKFSVSAYITFDNWQRKEVLSNAEFKVRRHLYCIGSCLKWHFSDIFTYKETHQMNHFFKKWSLNGCHMSKILQNYFFLGKCHSGFIFLLDVNFALTFGKAYAQMSDHSNWNMERTTYPKHFFKTISFDKRFWRKIITFRHHNSIVELLHLFGLTANRINYITKINSKFHAYFPNLFMKQ